MGYTKDAVKGLSWMSGYRIITRLFAYVRIALLARLLTPDQFGLFGIASLMLSLLDILTNTGTSVYLVQQKRDLKEYVDSAYAISIIRGILLSLVLFWASPLMSSYFNSPNSLSLLRLISLVPLIRGFISPSRVVFLKDLEFKKEAIFSFGVFLLDSTISVIVAFWLRSPISLVWGLIAGALLESSLSHLLISPRPKLLQYKKEHIKEMIKMGKWTTGATIFNYFFENGDDAVVGKILGVSSLGIYQAAYKLSTLPITEITRVFNQVTFPVYTNIAGDTKRLKRAFTRITLVILLLVLPIGLILYFYAREIVLLVLGQNWLQVVPVLKLLALFGVVRSFVISVNPLFNSAKKQEYLTYITATGLAVMLATIVPMVSKYKILGAGYSVLMASLATLPIVFGFMFKVLKDSESANK